MARPLVPDDLWAAVAPLLPPPRPRPKGGRPPIPDRAALTGILFVLKSGLPWEMLPAEMGCGSGMSCWRRLRDRQEAGVRAALHRALLERLHGVGQLDWSRASIDSASVPAKRGRGHGTEPDRPRQAGYEAAPRRGRPRHAARPDAQPGQPPRRQDARPHLGRRAPGPFGAPGPPAAASGQAARRQRV